MTALASSTKWYVALGLLAFVGVPLVLGRLLRTPPAPQPPAVLEPTEPTRVPDWLSDEEMTVGIRAVLDLHDPNSRPHNDTGTAA